MALQQALERVLAHAPLQHAHHRGRLPGRQRGAGAQLLGGMQRAPGVRRAAHIQRRRRAVVRQVDRLALLGAPAGSPQTLNTTAR